MLSVYKRIWLLVASAVLVVSAVLVALAVLVVLGVLGAVLGASWGPSGCQPGRAFGGRQ